MDDLLREFLAETNESIDKVDIELVRFEQEPNNAKILDNIFRLVHTIKGTCGFLGLPRLETLTHSAETLMGRFREGMPVKGDAVSVILATIDRIKDILAELERAQQEPAGGDPDLISRLERLAHEPDATPDEAFAVVRAVPLVSEDDDRAGEIINANPTIRVTVETIEKLMTLVSELVLTRNQLLDVARHEDDPQFKLPLQRLSTVTAELQEGVTKTRMQPIGQAWQKLPRLVRDLGAELGKEIELQMSGADTELDRHVLELIKDPLTHMVRNAADHGLETPDERRRVGKSEKGVIRLAAHQEGGHIVIEIADDGRGLNLERIKSKAASLGLAQQSALDGLSESQVQKLIFAPGFSTASQITSISGRGVGMDVVKTNIDQIGGTIEVRSVAGEGSRFIVKIPLTLAIVGALIVEAGEERFAIPQIAVVELVPTHIAAASRIEFINDAPVLRLRDQLLPLVQLTAVFGDDAPGLREINHGFIVVMQVGRHRFGVVLDGVIQTEEIVVKPLSRKLRHVAMFSGTTILGDGSVILIIDPNGIADTLGNAVAEVINDVASSHETNLHAETKIPLLLFRAGSDALKATPVGLLTRLEEIERTAIEWSDGRAFVQYRGRLMPLMEFQGGSTQRTSGAQSVLVFSEGGRSMGLLVDEIVDIVEGAVEISAVSATPGILGAAIVDGCATEIIDVDHWLSAAFGSTLKKPVTQIDGPLPLLLVDDSEFFRTFLPPILASVGHPVVTLASADEAIARLRDGLRVQAILCDLEMPGLNGFQFAQAVRADPRHASLPIVAIDSHASAARLEQIRLAGFSIFVAKFDRPGLVAAVRTAIALELVA